MTKDEVLMMALEALKANDLLINGTEKAGGLAWCIDGYYSDCFDIDPINEQTERAITAIKEALAQHDSVQAKPEPEQEPVAMVESVATVVSESGNQEVTMSWWHEPALPVGTKLYTTPPQRTWVGLTDEEMLEAIKPLYANPFLAHNALEVSRDEYQAIEAKLKERNT